MPRIASFDQALIARDFDALRALTAADFRMINPVAHEHDREGWLAWLAETVTYARIDRDEARFRSAPGLCIVTGVVHAAMAVKGYLGGAVSVHHTIRTEVWMAGREGSRLLHVHLTAVPMPVSPGQVEDEAALKELERRRVLAVSMGDAAALAALYADDFRLVHGDGTLEDKAAAIATTCRRPLRVVVPREVTFQFHGEIALLAGPCTVEFDAPDGSRRARVFIGQLARKRDGTWRYVWAQVTLCQEGE